MKFNKIALVLCLTLLLVGCSDTLHYADVAAVSGTSAGSFTYTPSDDMTPTYHAQTLDSIKYYDGYLYILPGTDSPPYRYNVATGNVTCACNDPLCLHNSAECPFYGLSHTFYITPDGGISFHRIFSTPLRDVTGAFTGDFAHINDFARIDKDAMSAVTLESFGSNAGFSSEIYDGDFRYYHGVVYDPDTEENAWGLLKMNIRTGERAWFGAGVGADGEVVPLIDVLPCFMLGERLYFQGTEGIFSLDKNGENRIDHAPLGYPMYDNIATDGEYLYYRSHEAASVCRIPLGGGEPETIASGVYDEYHFTENYIYYRSGEELTLGKASIRGYAASEVVLSGGEIHRCRHDGSEDTLVYTFAGEWAGVRPLNAVVVGNYYYCFYSWWTDADGDGVYEEGDNGYSTAVNGKTSCTLLRVDLTTGETIEIEVKK